MLAQELFATGGRVSMNALAPNLKPIVRNSILRGLPLSDFARIRPFLRTVSLKGNEILQDYRKQVEHIDFIETGIISLRTFAGGNTLETAMVGRQGVVGASVALGAQTSMHRCIVLVPGSSLRIRTDELYNSMQERPQIREHILRYVQALMIHGSQTALCGVRHELEQRLACWLCLATDGLNDGILPVTHENLSLILGLRRAGVTESLSRFESQGLIRKMRGVLEIREHGQLKTKSCFCYGVIANAYKVATTIECVESEM